MQEKSRIGIISDKTDSTFDWQMHATVSVTNLKPIQKLVFQFQDDQSNSIAVKDVSLAPPYLSNRGIDP